MISNRSHIALALFGLSAIGVLLLHASIPAPNGVIYGCYNKSGGSIRVIDNAVTTCNTNETQLTWNQTGPQGLIGPQGPPGPAGPEGPAGPSHTFFVSTGKSGGSPFHAEATLTVPAGTYIIDGRVVAFNLTSNFSIATCFLGYSSLAESGDGIQVSVPGTIGSSVAVPLHDAQTFSVSTAINLNCTDNSDLGVQDTVLRATLVGGLN